MMLTVIIFIFTLLILVVIHELGHFLMAKKFNIKVEEFGFGIPPRVFGKKVGETIISLNWLPFGGFVRLLGEDEVDKEVLKNKRSFAAQTVGKRIGVVIAGVFMNLILAFLLFYFVLFANGFKAQFPLIIPHEFIGVSQKNESAVVVREVSKSSPAGGSGLLSGERILSVNGESLSQISDLQNKTKDFAGKELVLTVSSTAGENIREIKITPRENPPEGEGPMGVSLVQFQIANLLYETPVQKLFSGSVHSLNIVAYSSKILGNLIAVSFEQKTVEPVSQTLAGPVGITSIANSILTESSKPFINYLEFMALLSLNLAVLNIVPFPALDGGRLLFLGLEAVTRRKVKAEVEKWVHTIGMIILLTLMILVTLSDIRKIFP